MSVTRRLGPGDTAELRDHLLRLSPEARRDRFSGQVSDETVADYVATIDWLSDLLLGWVGRGRIRAAVQLVVSRDPWRCDGELAATVESDWQDRGIGTELCRRMPLSARNRSVLQVRMICLQENRRMQRIVRKLDGAVLYLDGEVEGRLGLAQPNYLSFLQEALRDGGSLVEALADQWQKAPCPAPRQARRRTAV